MDITGIVIIVIIGYLIFDFMQIKELQHNIKKLDIDLTKVNKKWIPKLFSNMDLILIEFMRDIKSLEKNNKELQDKIDDIVNDNEKLKQENLELSDKLHENNPFYQELEKMYKKTLINREKQGFTEK